MFGDIKKNDRGWDVVPFPSAALIDTHMTSDFEAYADCPHIGIGNIEKDTGALVNYKAVGESGLISGKYPFDERHIIYSKIRPNLNKVALPTFRGLCSADSYPILPRVNCNRQYLAVVLRSELFLGYILGHSGRTNIPKVNKAALSGFKLPLPPLDLQHRFADFVRQVDKSKFEIQQGLEKLELQYNALMQRCFG
jgi:type I restriction enzyme S subunit